MAPIFEQLLNITSAFESTYNTPINATAKRMNVTGMSWNAGRKNRMLPSIRGGMSKMAYVRVAEKEEPKLNLAGWGSYQDTHELESFFGAITPVFTTVYTRDHIAPLNAQPVTKGQVIYFADNDADGGYYRMNGSWAQRIEFKAEANKELQWSCDYLGTKFEPTDLTSSQIGVLADRAQTPIMMNDMTLFVDAIGGTIGTTAVTPAGYNWRFALTTARSMDYQGGSMFPVGRIEGDWTAEMEIQLQFNATNKALFDAAFQSANGPLERLIRAKFTNGTNILQFDFAGAIEDSPRGFNPSNNTITVPLKFRQAYSSTLANHLKIQSVNSIALLP